MFQPPVRWIVLALAIALFSAQPEQVGRSLGPGGAPAAPGAPVEPPQVLPLPSEPPGAGPRLIFESNLGQVGPPVRFLARGLSAHYRIGPAAVTLVFRGRGPAGSVRTARLEFRGANEQVMPEPLDPQQGRVDYLAGADPSGWIRDIPTYGKLIWRGLYPGTDLVLEGNRDELRLVFSLSPEADPDAIKLEWTSPGGLEWLEDGGLALDVAPGRWTLEAPVVETPAESGVAASRGRFLSADGGAFGLGLGSVRRDGPVTVRLGLRGSRELLGAIHDETRLATAVNGAGHVFLAGSAFAGDPTDPASPLAQAEAFLMEFSAGPGALLRSVYFGGAGLDGPAALALDAGGAPVVAGWTTSGNFPGTPAADASLLDHRDGFVIRLNPGTLDVDFARTFGGSGDDEVLDVAISAGGALWLAGRTDSADFPVTEDGAQPAHGGGVDGFVVGLGSGGTWIYGTYLGGEGADEVSTVEPSPAGDLFLAGATASLTWAAAETEPPAARGGRDGFVAGLRIPEGVRFWALLAGSGDDRVTDLALGRDGALVAVGATESADFGAVGVTRLGELRGQRDGFVAELDPLGGQASRIVLLGGEGRDSVSALAVRPGGSFVVVGETDSAGFPGNTGGAASGRDVFVSTLDPILLHEESSRRLGGSGDERATAVATDGVATVYVTGVSSSEDPGGLEPAEAERVGGSAFIGRVDLGGGGSPQPLGVCPGSINFDNDAGNGLWQEPTNWDTDTLPGPTDDVCIDGFNVTLSSGTHSIQSLRVQGAGSLTISNGSLTIAATSEIQTPFTLSGGTLTGAADLTIDGLFTWSGGTHSGTGTTTANGGMDISGTNTKTLNTRTLNNSNNGTATWTGTGNISFANNGTFNNEAGSTFDVQNDQIMSGTGTFNNPGTFTKSAGAGTTTVGVTFNSDGTASSDSASGTLSLNGGGNSGGSFSAATNATLDFGGGTHTLTATSSVTGAGTVLFSGGTANINGTYNVTGTTQIISGTVNLSVSGSTNMLTQSGGTLGGSGTLTVSGLFTWTGGTQGDTGTTTVQGGMDISGTATKTLNSRTLNNANNGTATWSDTGNISFSNNGTFNNEMGSIFDVQNDQFMSGTGTFNNSGTFTKSAGAGTTHINIPFNNDGTASADAPSSTLSLNGGGNSGGSFSAATNATLDFGGGTHTLTATSSATGAGTVLFSGGTANINGTYNVTGTTQITFGTVNLSVSGSTNMLTQNGGTLGGSSTLTVSGLFTWTGGTQGGTGTTTVQGGMDISGPGTKRLNSRTLNNSNNGTATWTGTGNISFSNNGTFNNELGSTFDVQSDQIMSGTGTFNNPGTFTKSAGAGTTTVGVTFNSDGTASSDSASGTLSLNGGGNSGGSFSAATNASLDFGGGTHTLTATSSVTGAGTVLFSGGTTNINGTYNVTGTTQITSGTVNLNVPGSTNALTQSGGTLGGSGTLTVSGLFTWTGGTQGGTGTTTVQGGMDISGPSTKSVAQRTLNNSNNGTATWTGTGNISFSNNGTFNNEVGSTFDAQNDEFMTGTGTFNSAGTFTKSAGAGTTTVGVTFNNDGSTSSDAAFGTLRFSGDGTSSGSFTAAADATLEFFSGTRTLGAASSVTGAGTVLFSSGTTNINGTYNVTGTTQIISGTVNLNVPGSTNALAQSGGTLGGSGTLTVAGLFTWTGGTQGGTGTTTVQGGMDISGTATKTLNTRTLNNSNNGTATWTGTGNISFTNNGTFNNELGSTFDAQNDQSMSGTGAFNNDGTVTKSAGAGRTTVGVTFNNDGSTSSDAAFGTLRFSNDGISNGSFSVAADATLEFFTNARTLGPTSSVTGAGTVLFSGGETTVNGTYNVTGTTQITGATFHLTASGSTGTLIQSGGQLTGPGTLTVSGQFTWTGGTQGDTGTTIVQGGMDISGPGTKSLNTRTLNNSNNGTATWTGTGAISFGNNGTFNNEPGSTFDVQNDESMSGTGTFNNAGTFMKSAGAGTTSMNVLYQNTGTTEGQSGTLSFTNSSSPYTQTAGVTRLNGGSFSFNATANFQGGSLAGGTPGSITGNVTTSGTASVDPGLSAGLLNIAGNYSQGASAAYNVEIGGLVAGTDYDQFNMTGTGSATLDGVLNVTLINAFTPNIGDSFTIMTFASRTGQFATTNLPPLPPDRIWQIVYGDTDVVLKVVSPVSADLALTKTDSPDPVFAGDELTYTLTVSNAGPDDANNVVLTDTLPANVTFVSATGTGWACSESGGTVTCTRAAIAGTTSAPDVTIVVTPQCAAVGSITNVAGVSADESDPDTANNSASADTTVEPQADLSIVKSDSPDPVNAAGTLTYTLDVANNGPCDASSVAVTDTLPAGTTFVSASGTGWSCGEVGGVVTCTRPTLAVGSAPPITITVTAPAAPGTITNTSDVTAAEFDPDTANNSDSEPTDVTAEADLSITKTDSPDPVDAAAPLTYTLNVANAGPSDATSVSITDTLPAGTTFVSASGTGWTCSESGGVVTCTRPNLAVGAAPPVTITVTAPNEGGTVTNTCDVSAAEFDPDTGNNAASEVTTVVPIADLAIVKSDSPDPVDPAATLIYTLDVTNNGPSTGTSVTVTDTLPSGVTFVSASGTGWTCSEAGGIVTCTRPSLAPGAAPPITITVTAPVTPGTITNTCAVSATENDPNTANNTATEDTQVVVEQADLSITKADSPDPVDASATLTYTLDVANAGPDPATSVTVTDTLPPGVTFVSASGTGWTCSESGGVVTCTRPTLAVGAAPPITVTVTAPSEGGTITNAAGVTAGQSDPDLTNNTATEGTTVTPVVDLSITKADSPDPVDASATLTYTLDVASAGPSTATGVTVTDTLPAGVSFVSASGTGWTCSEAGGVVTCTRATLAPGTAPTITITVTAPSEGGTITNTASVAGNEADPDTADNSTSETTSVTPLADLSIIKGDSPDPVNAAGTLSYTLDLANAGPSTATGVTVTDTLPAGVTFVSASGTGWTCSEAGGVVTCTRATLAPGTAPTLTITVTAPSEGGTITNTASVAGNEADPDTADNSTSETTTVTPLADLSIVKSDSSDPVTTGSTFTYTLSVTNAGPSTATGVVVSDTLPTGVVYTAATGSGWTCSGSGGGVVTCTRPSLAPGTAPPISITVVAPGVETTLVNNASVSAAEPDPSPSGNTTSETTTVTSCSTIEDLMIQVEQLDLRPLLENRLLRPLESAQRALDAGNPFGAISGLHAFIRQVEFIRRFNPVVDAEADALVDCARVLIQAIRPAGGGATVPDRRERRLPKPVLPSQAEDADGDSVGGDGPPQRQRGRRRR